MTLDSIRNSCDVLEPKHNNSYERKIDSNLVPLADANFPSMIPGLPNTCSLIPGLSDICSLSFRTPAPPPGNLQEPQSHPDSRSGSSFHFYIL